MWKMVILTPKGDRGNFRGVVLVEVIWNTISSLLNHWLTVAITYHDVLHRFRSGRGTGTANLKDKLLQQLTAMREAVLLGVLLDLQKV